MNDCDEILCRTVADCDELLDCLDDMRRIDASSSSPAPARIDDLETSLRCMRAMYAEQGAQEAIANKADASPPAADTHKERREREARWRDELPNERLRRASHWDALGVPKRQGSSSTSSPAVAGTNVQPDFDIEWKDIDSPHVIWFDVKAVAAAADSLTGSRSGVVLAMQNSMRSNKRLGKSV
mmetsp:Transcript_48849/g.116307  ORF Transcript_48849/g.116307 Transcript_48849/m.116307 type:complete len:183 (-) Transcript_48849:51-599(-)